MSGKDIGKRYRKKMSEQEKKKTLNSKIEMFSGKKAGKVRLLPFALAMLIIMGAGISYIVKTNEKIRELEKTRTELVEKNEELEKEKEDLTAEIQAVTSPEYMERIARRDLKLIKSNELLFILPEDTGEAEETEETEDADKEQD